jgi:hypothetical protein
MNIADFPNREFALREDDWNDGAGGRKIGSNCWSAWQSAPRRRLGTTFFY